MRSGRFTRESGCPRYSSVMMTLNRLALLISGILPLTLAPSVAVACSCVFPGGVTSEALDGTTVFRGTARTTFEAETAEPSDPTMPSFGQEYETTFDIRTLYHSADGTPERITVTHILSGAACGKQFTPNQSYFVVAQVWRGKLRAGLCEPFTEAQVIADLDSDTSIIRSRQANNAADPAQP